MTYKKGLRYINENSISGSVLGGAGSSIGNHGGSVGNEDFYATGDARVPKIIGDNGNDPFEYIKKGKRKGKHKTNRPHLYRRAFIENLMEQAESTDEERLGCIIYAQKKEDFDLITDALNKFNTPFLLDNGCHILSGTDNSLQDIIEKLNNILTDEPFNNGDITVLIGELSDV